jgi:phosphoribosylformimino-5-aminoimidazole carboxamide ribotide isomerase
VVDLNGAVTGKPIHRSLIEEIVRNVPVPVEAGGGIRDQETIAHYLSVGVGWVILGTVAFKNPALIQEACRRFPGRVILGLDAKRGRVAIQGWKETVSLAADDLVRRFEGTGLSSVIFTDIERDGMGTGVNWELTKTLAEGTSVPIIASGGISRLEEIVRLKKLEPYGIAGVIVGRALYTGQVDLREAIQAAK